MYLITGSSGVYIIDPSVSPDSAEDFTGISGLAKGDAGVKAIFLTHGHHDHIKHINDWIKAYPFSQVFFSSNDSELLTNSFMNCSYMEGSEVVYSFKFTDDYYHSGDLIEWVDEAQGLFRFKSRKNELINVGGYKVNPGEVEVAIQDIEGVRQAMVYGKANSILGNVLCADVVLEPGFTMTELDIKKVLGSQLQDFKVPRRIKFVEEISLTRTGKMKRV